MGLFNRKSKVPYRPTGRFALGKIEATGVGWLNHGDEITFQIVIEEVAVLGSMSKIQVLDIKGDPYYYSNIRNKFNGSFQPTSNYIWHDPSEWKDEYIA